MYQSRQDNLIKMVLDFNQEVAKIIGENPNFADEYDVKKWINPITQQLIGLDYYQDFNIGFMIWQKLPGNFNYLINLYVAPQKRKNGYASRWLLALLYTGPVLTLCHEKNVKAIDFYTKNGFKVQERIPAPNGYKWLFNVNDNIMPLACSLALMVNAIKYRTKK